jgi:penicillin G amidase
MGSRGLRGLLVVLGALVLAAPAANAGVRRAESVLPPGQSGFVSIPGVASGTGSPHLTDQTDLFVQFRFKQATFNQPGDEESPRPGVRIVRDAFGVPAITAQTDADVWFGAGYAVAQDRLFQLELFRRATTGRLSEILGKDYLEDDIVVRRDFYTAAELDEQIGRLPAHLQARFDAYRDGINAWIQKTRSDPTKMPGEFPAVGMPTGPSDWTVRDSAAIGVYLARTVPSDDGEEIANLRALRALGPRLFNRLLPLRTKGQVPTVPRSEGLFKSQPGRTRKQERRAYKRSQRFLADVSLPEPRGASAAGSTSGSAREGLTGLGRPGGSNMWALRGSSGNATLFNGPQLGFSIPELFVEYELHRPGLDVRGATAPGVPVLGLGHSEHVAWGVTSGLSDDDDLYVEQLAGSDERYRFQGEERQMECRDETFTYRPPPTDLVPPADPPEQGSRTERLCRTVHGPVQQREGSVAFARRYAIWGREVETLEGLASIQEAQDVADVDRAVDRLTWNENLMVADDKGNIGYWHPGLLQLKPRGFDERLPYPGTGEAEWRGFLEPDRRPQVINPPQGYLFQWNNIPSQGWTSGDAPARERLSGPFHRARFLGKRVSRAVGADDLYQATADVDKVSGTVAQQRPLAAGRLRRAARRARGGGKVVLDTIRAWGGSYHAVDGNDTVDPGVAAWDAFKLAAEQVALGARYEDAKLVTSGKGSSHVFDVSNGEAYALRTLRPRGYRQAANLAFGRLERRFGSADPARWREPRRMYTPTAQGAGNFDPIPFFDRGTFQHVTELGP